MEAPDVGLIDFPNTSGDPLVECSISLLIAAAYSSQELSSQDRIKATNLARDIATHEHIFEQAGLDGLLQLDSDVLRLLAIGCDELGPRWADNSENLRLDYRYICEAIQARHTGSRTNVLKHG